MLAHPIKMSPSLARKCIPDSNLQIEEIGTARVVQIDGVDPSQEVHRKEQGLRQIAKTETQAGTRCDVVRPVLMEPVRGDVAVPIQLRLQAAPAFGGSEGVTRAVLRIVEHIVLKAADEDRIVIGLREEPVGAVHQMAETLGVADAA